MQQCPGTLGEFKPVQQLIGHPGRMASYHVTDMHLRHFVIAQVDDLVALLP